MAGALDGIKVIDLTNLGPGARCARILADMGADVLRLVDVRSPALPLSWWTYGARRNTRVMGVDLKQVDGLRIFKKLLEGADVLMVGMRPSAVERLGIHYAAVRETNPRLIYCSCTAFGADGPYRDVAGHDINYQSLAGSLGMTGKHGDAPVIPGVTLADSAGGGMQAAIGILAAIIARQRTGRGQFVDVAATEGVVDMMALLIDEYLVTGHESTRGETILTGKYPWYNVYRTKDGTFVSVGAIEPQFYANLCRLLGRPDLIPYQHAEGDKQEEVFAAFREIFLTKTRDEWTSLLMHADTCTTPVYTISEVVSDPHLRHRQMVIETEHPVHGKSKQVGMMTKFSDTKGQVRNIAPEVGECTEQILADLGYSRSDIKALRDACIVK